MNFSSISSATTTNLSSIAGDVFTNVINVTEGYVGDFLDHFAATHINVTRDIANTLSNVTEKGVISLTNATNEVGICDFIISNFTSGNVTSIVTSYDPADCGLASSYPFLQPLLIFILVCFTLWAIFGNGCLVSVIATDENLQEPGNIFLCAMAFTDVAQSLLFTPFAIHSLVHGEYPSEQWCRFQAFCIPLLATLSIYLQASLWACRYIHIAHPVEYHSVLTGRRLGLAMVLCFLIALASPLVGLAREGKVLTWTVDAASVDIAEPVSLMTPCVFGGPEFAAMVVLCSVGVVICCCFAGLIYREARINQQKHNVQQAWLAQEERLEEKLKAAKTLGLVVGVQWVTWIPLFILGFLNQVKGAKTATLAFCGDIFYIVNQTSTFSDSIVYALRNKIYRKAMAKLYRKIRNAINDL